MSEPLYRVAPLPAKWPGTPTPTHARKPGPFGENWGGTLKILALELRKFNARDVVLHMDVKLEDLRIDGMVRADARPGPAIILAFRAGADRMSFPCDRFNWWQTNLRAIALVLEALRKVDRYGVQAGRQYEGFKALPPGGRNGQAPAMTTEEAATVLEEHSGLPAITIENDAQTFRVAARLARAVTHPDKGGDTGVFQRVEAAIHVLEEALS